ncbi:hypothetical protein BDN67DRAFT_948373 [Paxillus ammoniavirescens]|nr:hypothetical protein BDN67DRAFT_948373 [Paxillus ammoniavirescens]
MTNPPGTLKLCVAHYWRGYSFDGQRLPLHWALFLISNATPQSLGESKSGRESADGANHLGTCYQAIGNIDTFAYSETEECMEILAEEYRGCLPLGDINASRLVEVAVLMQQVRVHRGREDWNCQNWVLAAVEKLKAKGLVALDVTANGIRNELEDILREWKS